MRSVRGATGLAGVVLIDKPAGFTSHDVINVLRKATGEGRIGHTGTLDPMATGLLLVLIGRATRLEQYLVGHDKGYEARIVFGSATDTLDADGTLSEEAPVPDGLFQTARAQQLLGGLVGRSEQMPPAYSAIKRDGVAAHRLARAGETPRLDPRSIEVYRADLLTLDQATTSWDVAFEVSKGTYVRSLARDIGTAAGTVAHLGALRRTGIGIADVREAHTLDAVVAAAESDHLPEFMSDPVPLLGMPIVETDADAVRDGRALPAGDDSLADGERATVVSGDTLLGVYRREGARLVADCVLVPGIAR
ncbi:MAG: tRNA pseudouridine(55) synthase TruB [Coriobacteriia bacterium]|nr:tRNA pseudouridine(55) synthase TruB [Coriobacteriia bacterium]